MALFCTETGDRIFWTRTVFSGLAATSARDRNPPSPLPLMNPGYLPGKLMCAYHVFVRPWPLYQRNGLTFDKIGCYYPFLLSPQGVAHPASARCFVLSSFNCRASSRDQVRTEFRGKTCVSFLLSSSEISEVQLFSEGTRVLFYFKMAKRKKKNRSCRGG